MHSGDVEESGNESPIEVRARRLLTASAQAERRLLRQERKAEKRLTVARSELLDAEARLQRAQTRVDECRQAVLAAEGELEQSQRRRASGPATIES
jgi:hypothetical protein